ncbi:MAG: RHS repeat-associated core domain-containing protein [Acidimicrobiales bacterium]
MAARPAAGPCGLPRPDRPYPAASTGDVFTFGYNGSGQLGNGTTTEEHTPVEVDGLPKDIVEVAGGHEYSLALSASGSVYAFGDNTDGILGESSPSYSTSPVEVEGLSDIVEVAAGYNFALALTASGTVYEWGSNYDGQSGDGTTSTTPVTTPVEVSGLSQITEIAAGGYHALALASSGKVYSWGYNGDGQLGLGSTTETTTPTEISGLSDVSAVTAGTYFSAVMTISGEVYTFGDNSDGELGIGSETSSEVPEEITGVTAHAIEAGGFQLIVEKSDGTLWATGQNTYGQLGNGTETSSDVLTQVSGITNPAGLAGGGYDSLVLMSTGMIEGFGSNANGRLGSDSTTDSDVPVQADGFAASGASSYAYTYNGDGLRMSVTTTSSTSPLGVTSQFTWDTEGFTPELVSDGTNDFIYGPNGTLLEQVSPTGTYYVLTDDIGSTRVLTNTSGVVAGTASYSAYGELASSSGQTSPIGFAGGYTDPTGLIYLVNRYYDPTTGQFLSVDPDVGITEQPYVYTGGDPVDGSDPLGVLTCPSWIPFCGEITRLQHDFRTAANDIAAFGLHNFGTIAQLAAGAACIVLVEGCVVVLIVATGLKVFQDVVNHVSGAQIVADAVVGLIGSSYAGLAAGAVSGLEEGSVQGLNALINEIESQGESSAALRGLRLLLRASGFAPYVLNAIVDEIEGGTFQGICLQTYTRGQYQQYVHGRR